MQLGERTASSPASRSRSSSRCYWASAGVIDGLSPSSEIVRTRAFRSRAAVTGRLATGGWVAAEHCVTPQSSQALWVVATDVARVPRWMPEPSLCVSHRRSRGVGAVRLSRCDHLVNERREVMRWQSMQTVGVEAIPETSGAERIVADVYAIGAPALDAERVRDSVPLWFHTFALAPGIYTPGIARDHGYRLAVLGADRFAGRSVLDVGAFDGFYSFLAEARGARRVVAVDNEQYVDWVRARFGVTLEGGAGFRAIAGLVGSRVEYRRMDALEVDELWSGLMLCCVSASCIG